MPLAHTVFTNLTLPVIGAPMFLISNPDLVIAQCRAGIIGAFPALNARTTDFLDEWLTTIREKTAGHAPFAVNMILHKSNTRLKDDLAVCARHRVPIVITSLGAVREVYDAVHAYGGIVLHDVTTTRHAHKALSIGADGLIAVCAGAGGHGGTLSPFALVQEIRAVFDGPLFVAGSIATGDAVLATQAMGADGAYVGSLFIASEEAAASDAYKRMLIEATAADIVYTPAFTGIPGNYLKPSIAAAGLDPDKLPAGPDEAADFRKAAEGKKAWKDIYSAGQGVGAIHDIAPAARIIERLKREYDAARRRLCD